MKLLLFTQKRNILSVSYLTKRCVGFKMEIQSSESFERINIGLLVPVLIQAFLQYRTN
jgi:hypothetical protein